MIGSVKDIRNFGTSGMYSQQIIWFALGLIWLGVFIFVDYRFMSKFYVPIYVFNIILLVAVLVQGSLAGDTVSRWLHIVGPVRIQPSEFTKLFMIIYLSKFIDNKRDSINNVFVLAIYLISVMVPVILIYRQPSLSASLVVAFISFAILFVGNISYKYVVSSFLLAALVLGFLTFDFRHNDHLITERVLLPHMVSRIDMAFNPIEGSPGLYQQERSIRAIGSGQLLGKGLYQKDGVLPEAHNDFIFSVIGEELGFVGAIAVMGTLLLLVLGCFWVAHRSTDLQGKLIATGVGSMLAFQTFVNIGVAIGMLPNTGISLPFISYGGSSMWVSMMSVGLVINVGMYKHKSIFEG